MTATIAPVSLFNEMLVDFFESVPYRYYQDQYECDEERDETVIKFLHDTPGMEFTVTLAEDETAITLSEKVAAILKDKAAALSDFTVNFLDWLLLAERYEAVSKGQFNKLYAKHLQEAA